MDVKKDVAEIAALIGEPTRVVMLWSLFRSSRIIRVTAKGREDVYKLLKLTL